MPQIRVLLGYQQGHVFSLRDRVVVIGRDPASDIVLHPDSPASRRHAEFFSVNGIWRVRDLGSVNGTALNGRPIKDEALRDSDEVIIGDSVFVFENKAAEAAVIAEAASHVNLTETKGYHNRPETQTLVHGMSGRMRDVQNEIQNAMGMPVPFAAEIMTALVSLGHVLLAGVPETIRSELARALGEVLGLTRQQVTFSPVLSPEALIGAAPSDGLLAGKPAFAQIMLAERLGKAAPAALDLLFEAMQSYRVTLAGQSCAVEAPFFVMSAMDTPSSAEALSPEQVDRFMFCLRPPNGWPANSAPAIAERESARAVVHARDVLALQRATRDLPVSDVIMRQVVRLVRATRPSDQKAPDFIRKNVFGGAGPRAAQHLILAAKGHAVVHGRLLVTADDVRAVAAPVLRHRIITNFSAASAGITADALTQRLIEELEKMPDGE